MYFISRKNEPNAYFAAFVKSVLVVSTGSRESSFKSVLFMAVQVMLCEHNKFYQNGPYCTPQLQYQQRTSEQQGNKCWVFSHFFSAISEPLW